MTQTRFTVAEGAGLVGVNEDTIRRWIKAGWLTATKERGAWSFTAGALMRAELRATLARQHRLT